MNFELIILCQDKELENFLNIFLNSIDKEDNIHLYNGDFQDLKFDAIVSPANSYGIMEGGFDMHLNNYLSNELNYKDFIKMIQKQLSKKVNLLQQPGSAILLETNNSKCPYLIHSPTMQIPSIIYNKEIVYWCIYNILTLIYNHNENCIKDKETKINTICMPGMGTGCGQLTYKDFVKLLYLAYKHFKQNIKKIEVDWEYAKKQYKELQITLKLLSVPNNNIYNYMNEKRY